MILLGDAIVLNDTQEPTFVGIVVGMPLMSQSASNLQVMLNHYYHEWSKA